jgi:hypothetical protein
LSVPGIHDDFRAEAVRIGDDSGHQRVVRRCAWAKPAIITDRHHRSTLDLPRFVDVEVLRAVGTE